MPQKRLVLPCALGVLLSVRGLGGPASVLHGILFKGTGLGVCTCSLSSDLLPSIILELGDISPPEASLRRCCVLNGSLDVPIVRRWWLVQSRARRRAEEGPTEEMVLRGMVLTAICLELECRLSMPVHGEAPRSRRWERCRGESKCT